MSRRPESSSGLRPAESAATDSAKSAPAPTMADVLTEVRLAVAIAVGGWLLGILSRALRRVERKVRRQEDEPPPSPPARFRNFRWLRPLPDAALAPRQRAFSNYPRSSMPSLTGEREVSNRDDTDAQRMPRQRRPITDEERRSRLAHPSGTEFRCGQTNWARIRAGICTKYLKATRRRAEPPDV